MATSSLINTNNAVILRKRTNTRTWKNIPDVMNNRAWDEIFKDYNIGIIACKHSDIFKKISENHPHLCSKITSIYYDVRQGKTTDEAGNYKYRDILINKFPNIKKINVIGNTSKFPTEVFEFEHLSQLLVSIYGNTMWKWEVIPDRIEELRDLEGLSLQTSMNLFDFPKLDKLKKLSHLKVYSGRKSNFDQIFEKISKIKTLEYLEIKTKKSLANIHPIKINPEEYFKNFPNLNAMYITGYRLQKRDGFNWNKYLHTEIADFVHALSLYH